MSRESRIVIIILSIMVATLAAATFFFGISYQGDHSKSQKQAKIVKGQGKTIDSLATRLNEAAAHPGVQVVPVEVRTVNGETKIVPVQTTSTGTTTSTTSTTMRIVRPSTTTTSPPPSCTFIPGLGCIPRV